MSEQHVTVLGGGHMGRALLTGLLRSGVRPERLSVGEASEAARLALARELGVSADADNARAVDGAAVVVLAVKPQQAREVVCGLAPQPETGQRFTAPAPYDLHWLPARSP